MAFSCFSSVHLGGWQGQCQGRAGQAGALKHEIVMSRMKSRNKMNWIYIEIIVSMASIWNLNSVAWCAFMLVEANLRQNVSKAGPVVLVCLDNIGESVDGNLPPLLPPISLIQALKEDCVNNICQKISKDLDIQVRLTWASPAASQEWPWPPEWRRQQSFRECNLLPR